MDCRLGDISDALEEMVPSQFAEDWDNVGLQLGKRDWQINKVWVALDPLPEVINEACQNQVDLVVTHHPLIFKPLTTIDLGTLEGTVIKKALDNRVGIIALHTNLDKVKAGVNDVLASKIGLSDMFYALPFWF